MYKWLMTNDSITVFLWIKKFGLWHLTLYFSKIKYLSIAARNLAFHRLRRQWERSRPTSRGPFLDLSPW
jgi:hypothetical protein